METNNTATSRQRYALFCITKKDYRNTIISKEEASRLIADAQQQSNYQKKPKGSDLFDYLSARVDELVGALTREFQVASKIVDDPAFMKSKNQYLFLGSGCGFSYIQYDKRSKKAKSIVKEAGKLRDKINSMVVSRIDKDFLKKLEQSGNPIQAHLAQNMIYKSRYDWLVVNYMEEQGVKNVWVKTIDD